MSQRATKKTTGRQARPGAALRSRNPRKKKRGRPVGSGGQARELHPEEVKRVLQCAVGTQNKVRNCSLFLLGLGSGMRIGEIVGLKVADVFPYGEVLPSVILEKHSTKSGKSREVFISNQARQELEEWLDQHHPQRFRDADTFLEAPLFPSAKGGGLAHLAPSSANRALKKMMVDAGIVGASSHSMRRTHAQTLRRAGADLTVIKEQLGHSSLAITGRYMGASSIEKAQVVGGVKF